jgi:hypothetical protein
MSVVNLENTIVALEENNKMKKINLDSKISILGENSDLIA